jgi:nucleotide-binding universal stress UspA family protein
MTDTEDHPSGGVVVGFDGSTPAAGAVAWAAAQAERTGVRLDLVTSWEFPVSWGSAIPLPNDYDPVADAQSLLDPVVEQLRRVHPALEVHAHVIEGNPGEVLVGASRSASLLVVANRGHRAFAGVLLGSVSQHCVTHADCPVVVYREPPPAP